jgi:hypothetical protein
LYQVIDRGERTDGTPEAPQEQKDDRDERPPYTDVTAVPRLSCADSGPSSS